MNQKSFNADIFEKMATARAGPIIGFIPKTVETRRHLPVKHPEGPAALDKFLSHRIGKLFSFCKGLQFEAAQQKARVNLAVKTAVHKLD